MGISRFSRSDFRRGSGHLPLRELPLLLFDGAVPLGPHRLFVLKLPFSLGIVYPEVAEPIGLVTQEVLRVEGVAVSRVLGKLTKPPTIQLAAKGLVLLQLEESWEDMLSKLLRFMNVKSFSVEDPTDTISCFLHGLDRLTPCDHSVQLLRERERASFVIRSTTGE